MKTEMSLKIISCVLLAFAWVSIPAFASGGSNDDDTQGQDQYQDQEQGQEQTATGGNATINIGGSGGVDGQSTGGEGGDGVLNSNASNEGIDVDASDHSSVENNSSNIVLVPNNNTENCLRVWGLAFGKNGESAALGLPFRSKKCDYEQAADDAFAQGERELGWFWKCENSNLSKSFRDHDDPSAACLDRMLGGMRATQTITTQTQTIETLLEEARSRDSLYRRQAAELKTKCSDEKNRMLEACMNTK